MASVNISTSTFQGLSQTIHDETAEGKNTAERVGNAFLAALDLFNLIIEALNGDVAQSDFNDAITTLQDQITAIQDNYVHLNDSRWALLAKAVNDYILVTDDADHTRGVDFYLANDGYHLEIPYIYPDASYTPRTDILSLTASVSTNSVQYFSAITEDNYEEVESFSNDYDKVVYSKEKESFVAIKDGKCAKTWAAKDDYGISSLYNNTGGAKPNIYRTDDTLYFYDKESGFKTLKDLTL